MPNLAETPRTEQSAESRTPSYSTGAESLKVIRRNQKVIPFDASRIYNAIAKAFVALERIDSDISGPDFELNLLKSATDTVVEKIEGRYPDGGHIHIEEIQDGVVATLVELRQLDVAAVYHNYRQDRAKLREEEKIMSGDADPTVSYQTDDGNEGTLVWSGVERLYEEACEGIADVAVAPLIEAFSRGVYEGISEVDWRKLLVKTAGSLIEREPNYQKVEGRLILANLRADVAAKLELSHLGRSVQLATQKDLNTHYALVFKKAISFGVEVGQLDPELLSFDLDFLGTVLRPEWDLLFNGLGLQTLFDRYFLKHEDKRYELPQVMFMRVAMGLALRESDRNRYAAEFYNLLGPMDFVSSTPTLFNAGTVRSQLSSCYISTVGDDLDSIMTAIHDNAMLAKWAGGLGNDWTPIRAQGSRIEGTNGISNGVVPFLNMVDATAIAVNQGGKRKGAVCVYLETWHLDLLDYLDLRKNTGDDRSRTHDTHTAHWIPDLFMKRVSENGNWTLFSPSDVGVLHDLYGAAFESKYIEYEEQADAGEIALWKRYPAREIWHKMLSALYETGHPWLTFKDAINVRSPQGHVGVVHSSNLCTEITLNTSSDEIAVCNLGSLNLANHVDNQGNVLHEKLANTTNIAIRMLDNVIDINYYAVEKAQNSNQRHRPIGLGQMGFQEVLFKRSLSYQSDEAVELADEIMEEISFHAISASSDLAVERGHYETYEGSLWSRGILPIDTLELLAQERGDDWIAVDTTKRMDWDTLRTKVTRQGMRNSNVMAIAPTATIALIAGVTSSIEPLYSNMFAKGNLSGDFIVVNTYLVNELKRRGLWDEDLAYQIKLNQGNLATIDGIPDDLKAIYPINFDVHPRWLIEAASRRQKWIDQSQSLNLYLAAPKDERMDGALLDLVYTMAWQRGLKTTYYLRTREASSIQRATIRNEDIVQNGAAPTQSATTLNATPIQPAEDVQLCLIDDPDCESCAG